MTQFLQQLVNGLSLGSIYALIALGYTMVYGIIKLINFAHGDIYMLGAFVAFYATRYFQLNFFLALIVAMLFCGVLGVVIERIAYKPLRHATRITALITAMGVSYILEYGTQFLAGSDVKTFPEGLLGNLTLELGGVRISMQQIMIFAVTILLMLALTYIVNRTRMGRAMRAVSVDEEAAQLMGISVDRTISFTFLLGSVLAGGAGRLGWRLLILHQSADGHDTGTEGVHRCRIRRHRYHSWGDDRRSFDRYRRDAGHRVWLLFV